MAPPRKQVTQSSGFTAASLFPTVQWRPDPEALKNKDTSLRTPTGIKLFGGTNRRLTDLKQPRSFALNPRGLQKPSFSALEQEE